MVRDVDTMNLWGGFGREGDARSMGEAHDNVTLVYWVVDKSSRTMSIYRVYVFERGGNPRWATDDPVMSFG